MVDGVKREWIRYLKSPISTMSPRSSRSRHKMYSIVFTTIILITLVEAEKCPPIFGEIECPLKFKCELNVCKNEQGLLAPPDCRQITCGPDARCYLGNCYSVEGLPCDRNVLVAENTARSITSNCGKRGKCINGRCAIDKCTEILCNDDDELCRDGKCVKMIGAFCFSVFDCGTTSGMECRANRCVRDIVRSGSEGLAKVECNPGEIFLGQDCVKQKDCEEVVCEPRFACQNGVCLPMKGADCVNSPCPDGLVCKENTCQEDPCHNRCPQDHACLNGNCRHIQGMFCHEECEDPYVCLNGQCVKNECAKKVCQLGERCEGGICIRIEGNLCTNPIRDCGEHFDCNKATCRDKIHPISGSPTPDSSA